jgi:hypothetical protein
MYTLKVLLADHRESFHRIISAFLKGTLSFDTTSSVTYGTSAITIPYTFNNASMTVTPIVVTNLNSITINSQHSINTTCTLVYNSVNPKYPSSFDGAELTAVFQLTYVAAEYSGTVAKSKDLQDGTYTCNDNGNGFNCKHH